MLSGWVCRSRGIDRGVKLGGEGGGGGLVSQGT